MGLGYGIRDPRSGIQKKPIPDPGSRGQKGTGSRIRNTGCWGLNRGLVQPLHWLQRRTHNSPTPRSHLLRLPTLPIVNLT
jgi:hypothetical protein